MTKIKNINTRIQLKNDTENNWNKAKAEEGKDGLDFPRTGSFLDSSKGKD